MLHGVGLTDRLRIVNTRTKIASMAGLLLVVLAIVSYQYQTVIRAWLSPSGQAETILISGNIEAHQSVLGFKTVQSRIVELPFDEGQWIKQAPSSPSVDDSDYRQQVAINQAALEVQQRQLATAKQNLGGRAKDHRERRRRSRIQEIRVRACRNADEKGRRHRRGARSAEYGAQAIERRHGTRPGAGGPPNARSSSPKPTFTTRRRSLKLAKIVLGYTTLRAPFDGVILVRQAEIGEIMAPGTPVVTLADLDHVWLRAYINETDIGKVRYGQERQGHDRHLSGQGLQGTGLAHLLECRVHAQERRDPCRARDAGLPHRDRHRQSDA